MTRADLFKGIKAIYIMSSVLQSISFKNDTLI